MWLQFEKESKHGFRDDQEKYLHGQISENWMDNRISEWMDKCNMFLEKQAWLLWKKHP